MANGDIAAAAGLATMNPARDIRLGADDINGILDGIVNWLGRAGGVPIPVSKGGTGKPSAAEARVALGMSLIQSGGASLQIEDDGRIHSDSLRGRTYGGNNPSGNDPGDNRLAVVTPEGTLGVLTSTLGDEYMPDSPTFSGKVTADNLKAAGAKNHVTSYGALHVDSDGDIGTVASAARYKTDVAEAGLDVEQLLAIEPKRFRLKSDPPGAPTQLGFIAEDFEPIAPELVLHDEDGTIEGLHYERVTVALHAIARSLHAELETLKASTQKDLHQLERRTDWLYQQLTGQPAPALTEGTT